MGIVIVLDVTKYFFTYSPAHWGWHQWVARPPQVRWPARPHLLGVAPVQCAVAVSSNICIIGVCTQELWFQIKGSLQFGLLSVFNRKIVFGGQEWNSFLFRYKCIFGVCSFVCQRWTIHFRNMIFATILFGKIKKLFLFQSTPYRKGFLLQTFLSSASASSCSGTSHWDLVDTHL